MAQWHHTLPIKVLGLWDCDLKCAVGVCMSALVKRQSVAVLD